MVGTYCVAWSSLLIQFRCIKFTVSLEKLDILKMHISSFCVLFFVTVEYFLSVYGGVMIPPHVSVLRNPWIYSNFYTW